MAIKDSQGPAANNALQFGEGATGTGGRRAPGEQHERGRDTNERPLSFREPQAG